MHPARAVDQLDEPEGPVVGVVQRVDLVVEALDDPGCQVLGLVDVAHHDEIIAADVADPRIDVLARRLCAANPDRVVWGSDWPHTPRHDVRKPGEAEELPFQDIDTKGLLALVPRWLGDDALVERVLVTNPERLYGFT